MSVPIACFVPPEGDTLSGSNFAPQFEPAFQPPLDRARFNIDVSACFAFRVDAQVTDQDGDALSFRWVANNRLAGSRCIDQGDVSQGIGERIVPQDDFINEVEQAQFGTSAGVLSLFVTDAATRGSFAWAEACLGNPGERRPDFGALVDPLPEDAFNKTVVEMRWTLNFTNNSGECPQ